MASTMRSLWRSTNWWRLTRNHRRRRTGGCDARPAARARPPGRRGRRAARGVRRRAGGADDGSRSAIDWIAVRGRLRRPAAGEVRDARRLRTMPATWSAFQAGDLPPGHVRTLDPPRRPPSCRRPLPRRRGPPRRRGGPLTLRRLVPALRPLARRRRPDGPGNAAPATTRRFTPRSRARRGRPPRRVPHHHRHRHRRRALEHLEQELFDADWAAAKAIHGDDVTTAHLAAPPPNAATTPSSKWQNAPWQHPPTPNAPPHSSPCSSTTPTLTGRVCELRRHRHRRRPGDILELLARDDTLIERAVFDSPNTITDISRARTFRGTLRRILDLTHRRCRHDTCFVPATAAKPTTSSHGPKAGRPRPTTAASPAAPTTAGTTTTNSRGPGGIPTASSSDRDEKAPPPTPAGRCDRTARATTVDHRRPRATVARLAPAPAVRRPFGAATGYRRGPDVVVDDGPRRAPSASGPPRSAASAWHEYPGRRCVGPPEPRTRRRRLDRRAERPDAGGRAADGPRGLMGP